MTLIIGIGNKGSFRGKFKSLVIQITYKCVSANTQKLITSCNTFQIFHGRWQKLAPVKATSETIN